MPSELARIESWLVEEWTERLASAIEAMAGERPAVSSSGLPVPPEPSQPAPAWRQPLPPLAGSIWVAPATGDAEALGAHVLRALGVEDSSEAEQKSTYQETLNQALAGLAQALTVRLKREVNHAGGSENRPAAFPPAKWTAVTVAIGGKAVTLQLGVEAALTEAIRSAEVPAPVPELAPPVPPAPRSPADNSKTFGLLLEVELPVAVSFGRAQIPLKDVLKLTTGSIVELNRAVTEPVEIIVNNCVIARGEVVVVEGNFGVRIQEVMNRQDRLRTVQ